MKKHATIALRISVIALFTWATLGVPLTLHMCSMMGAVGPFSTCTMDHATESTEDCCAADAAEAAADPAAPSIGDAAASNCCSDVLLAQQVQDDYTVVQPSAPDFPGTVFFTAAFLPPAELPDGARPASFSDISPPPIGDLYLIQSSLRI